MTSWLSTTIGLSSSAVPGSCFWSITTSTSTSSPGPAAPADRGADQELLLLHDLLQDLDLLRQRQHPLRPVLGAVEPRGNPPREVAQLVVGVPTDLLPGLRGRVHELLPRRRREDRLRDAPELVAHDLLEGVAAHGLDVELRGALEEPLGEVAELVRLVAGDVLPGLLQPRLGRPSGSSL